MAHLLYLLGRLLDAHRLVPATLNKLRNSHSPTGENGTPPWYKSAFVAPWNSKYSGYPNVALHASTPNLLFHLFAPPDSGPRYDRSRIHRSLFIPTRSESIFAFGPFKSRSPAYSAWGEMASKLEDETFRVEYVSSLHLVT